MKRFKSRLVATLIISLMSLLALGTSYQANTELTVINNSSKDLNIRISYRDGPPDSTIEEFILLVDNKKKLDTFHHANTPRSPDYDIYSIILFDENGDIIKEYNLFKDEENFIKLFDFEKTKKRNAYYILNITDELLK